jgi:hypothetical protein
MKVKKIMLVTLVLLAVLTIGAVSAADAQAADETQDPIGLSVDDNINLTDEYKGDSGYDDDYLGDEEDETEEIDYWITVYEEYDVNSLGDTLISWNFYNTPEDGNLTIYLDGNELKSYPVENYNSHEFSAEDLGITELAYGEHTINAVYSGDSKFDGFNNTYKFIGVWGFNAYRYYEDPWDIPDYYRYGQNVDIYVNPRDGKGNVTCSINGKKIWTKTADEIREWDEDYFTSNVVVIDHDQLAIGENNVTFTYIGDDYPETSKTVKVDVYPEILLYEDEIPFNGKTYVTLNLPSDAKGSINVYEADIEWGESEWVKPEIKSYTFIGTAQVKDGFANYTISGLSIDTHYLFANYTGTDYPVKNLGKITTDFGYSYYYSPSLTVTPIVDIPSRIYAEYKYNISIEVPETFEGVFKVMIGWEERSTPLVKGKASMELFNIESAEKDEWDEYGELYVRYSYGNDTETHTYYKYIDVSDINPKFELNITTPDALIDSDYYYGYSGLPRDLQGSIDIYIDGKYYGNNWVDYGNIESELYIANLTIGEHTIRFDYTGDGYYLPTSTQNQFNVTDVLIDIYDTTVTGNYTNEEQYRRAADAEITTSLEGGYYTLIIDGATVDMGVADKFTPISFGKLSYGDHEVEIIFKNAKTEKSKKQTVKAIYALYGDWNEGDIYTDQNKTIVIYTPIELSGNMIVRVDKNYTVQIKNGIATLTVSNLDEGYYNVYASYEGDQYPELKDEYCGSFDVNEIYEGSGITSNNTNHNLKYGEDIYITAKFDPSLGGKLYVYERTENKIIPIETVALVDGKATVKVSNLGYGSHEIIGTFIDYNDEDYWFDNDFDETYTVKPTVNGTADYQSESIIFGETSTITVELADDANGIVYLYKDDAQKYPMGEYKLTNGKATIELTNYWLMGQNIYLKYDDGKYDIFDLIFYLHVYPNITYPKQMDVGSDEYLIMHMPNDASGVLSVFDLNTTIKNGQGKIPLSNLSIGDHMINLVYKGDEIYGDFHFATQDWWIYTQIVTVTKTHSDISVVKSGNDLIVEMNSDATGDVIVQIKDKFYEKTLENGVATIKDVDVSDVEDVIVSYMGSQKYEMVNKAAVEIDDKPVVKTPADLTVTAKDIDEGETETITFTINKNATGVIDIELGEGIYTATITNGTASLSVSGLIVGDYTVTAKYGGNKYVLNDTKSATFKVNIVKVKADMAVTAEDIDEGANTTITVKINEKATGNVDINVAGSDYTAPIKNGTATLSAKISNPGQYTVTAKYAGNDYVLNDTQTATLNVRIVKTKADLKVNAKDGYEGFNEIITVTLNARATGTVLIQIGDANYTADISDGSARITLNDLKAGSYTATAKYAGNDYVFADEANATFTVKELNPSIEAKDLTVQYNNAAQLSATVYIDTGVPAADVPVTFKIDGKAVGTVNTNENGVATLRVSKTPKTSYKVTAQALEKSVTTKLKVKNIVTLKKVTVKKSAKKLVLQATLAKLNGKYLKNKKVTFKFNGKKYTAKTNSKGVAKVTIKSSVLKKLKVNKKITYQATYLKDTVKKTVKVKK